MRKKILSFILAAILTTTSLSTIAFAESEINNTQIAVETEEAEAKMVTVIFMDGDEEVGRKERVVIYKDTVDAADVSKIMPDGYEFVSADIIATSNQVIVTVKKPTEIEYIMFNIIYLDHENNEQKRVRAAMPTQNNEIVEDNNFNLNAFVNKEKPENYEVSEIKVDNENHQIIVTVKSEEIKPDSRGLRVNYVTESGRKVGSEWIEVKKGTNVLKYEDLKRIPEDYQVVNKNGLNILDTTKEIEVLVEKVKQEGSRTVVVKWYDGNKQVGKDCQVSVPASSKFVEKSKIEELVKLEGALPEGYVLEDLSDSYYINNGEVRIGVKIPLTPIEPSKPIITPTPIEPSIPVRPSDPSTPSTPSVRPSHRGINDDTALSVKKPHPNKDKKPVEEVIDIEENDYPSKVNPNTGAVDHTAGMAALAAVSLAGIAVFKKRK